MEYVSPAAAYATRLIEMCKEAGLNLFREASDKLDKEGPEVAFRMLIHMHREALIRKGIEPPEFPPEVEKFFFGGPLYPEFERQ